MFYEVLKDPDLLRQAQAEADALFAQGIPTAQGVQQLDVIKRAYMETLRLYSVGPADRAHGEQLVRVCRLHGFPAGQQVILEFTLAHYLPA